MNSTKSRLQNLANNVASKEIKELIHNFISLNVSDSLEDPQAKEVIYEALEVHADKNKKVKDFLASESNRNAIRNLGIGHALLALKKSKLYEISPKAKKAVDEIVMIKEAEDADFKIIDEFSSNINDFKFDDTFRDKMNGVKSKDDQFKAYSLVEQAIEELESDPNSELYGDVMMRLENAMALPASMIPNFIFRGLADYSGISPAIDHLCKSLALLNPQKQKHTLNNVKYVGNAKVYEGVVAPVSFGDDKNLVMLNNAVYSMTDDGFEEADIEGIDEKYLDVCNDFSLVNAEASGFEYEDDEFKFKVTEDEEGTVISVDDDLEFRVTDGWQSELLGVGAKPASVNLLDNIIRNKSYLSVLDNVIKLDSANDSKYAMYVITTGKKRHLLIDDAKSAQKILMKDIKDDELLNNVLEAFGADITPLLDSIDHEGAETEVKMKEITDRIEEINQSLELIYAESDEVQAEETVMATKIELETTLQELEEEYEQLSGQLEQQV